MRLDFGKPSYLRGRCCRALVSSGSCYCLEPSKVLAAANVWRGGGGGVL